MKLLPFLLLAAAAPLLPAGAQEAQPPPPVDTAAPAALFPFTIPWDDASPTFVSLAPQEPRPAGADGFVEVREGRLSLKGKRVRFFGINLCFGAALPSAEDAPKLAARLAKLGINCVRFHHIDTLPAPEGLLKEDGRTLHPAMLERLDFFVAELKKQGIYINLNLHVGRVYPGLPRWPEMPQYFKGIDQFHPAMIDSQKEYARALLTHRNPHTGTPYAEEPAVAFVEINNENSLIDQWWRGHLDTLPDPYLSLLRERWQQWLQSEAGSPEKVHALINAGREPQGPELLRPGLPGQPAWQLETHGSAQAELRPGRTREGHTALEVDISQTGSAGWHVQVHQGDLPLQAGKPYTFAFNAWVDVPRTISVSVSQANSPWRVLWSTQLALTPGWRSYRFVVTPGATDEVARIGFGNLGDTAGRFVFAAPSFRTGTPPTDPNSGPPDLLRRSSFAGNGIPLQQAWVRFLWSVEEAYWKEMRSFLKDDLRVGSLLVGTQVGFSPTPMQTLFDVVDVHAYWQHPLFPRNEWNLEHWAVGNLPMAGVGGGGTLGPMSLMRPEGKPYIVTEYSHPAPNRYGTESLPLLAAYAALQDWDAIFAFAYSHRKDKWGLDHVSNFFDIDRDPAKLVTLPAAVHLFCRGDLATPKERSVASLTQEQAFEFIRLGGPEITAERFGISQAEIFRNPVSLSLGGTATRLPAPPDGFHHPSANGELLWENNAEGTGGLVLINTPKTRGLIGSIGSGERHFEIGDLSFTPGKTRTQWACLLLTEQESHRTTFLRRTVSRYLLTATASWENTAMGWKDEAQTTVGTDWGQGPVLVEGVYGHLNFPKARSVRVWVLDERGERRGEVPVDNRRFTISPEHRTLWYEVEVTQ